MTVPFTFANAAGRVPASELDANFAYLGNNVATANTVVSNAQPNITSVGTLTSLAVTGSVVGGYFSGAGNALSNIQGANISGAVANAVYANVANSAVYSNNSSQATYANTANAVAGSNVSGAVAQSNYANTANAVSGGNVTGQVANALIAATVYENAQPNITTVGTLSNVSVSGNIYTNNLQITAQGHANGLISSETGFSTIGNIRGDYILGNTLSVTGNIMAAQVEALNYYGLGIGSINGTLTVSANVSEPELAWSFVNDYFGAGTSTLQAPLSDDMHIGEIVLPGTTGQGVIAFAGPNNGPFSNALNLLSSANILLSQVTGNGPSYITTFDIDGNWLMPNNVSITGNITGSGASPAPSINGFDSVSAVTLSASGNVEVGNVVFALDNSKFNSAAWTLVESFANLNFTPSSSVQVTMTNSIGYYKSNYNELVITYYGTPFGPGGQIQTTLPTPAISVPGLFVIGVAAGAAGAPFTIQWSNINSGNTTIRSGTGGDTAYVGIYAR